MYCNVGSIDRKVRIALGISIIILGFAFQSWFFLLGWIPLASGLLEFCPIYALLGKSTSKIREKFWH